MTLIENDSPKVQYTGPFIRGQLLPLTFPYIATEDVKMIIDDTPAIFNVDYEIITEPNDEHPVAYPNSAYIKNDLPNAKQITLYRVTPLDQQAPFPQQSKFRSERVEQALDKLTMQQQEQEEQLSRCIIAPITLETFNGQLPAPAADQALKWNTEGTELENYDIIGEQEAFEQQINQTIDENQAELLEIANSSASIASQAMNVAQSAVDTANTAQQIAEAAEAKSDSAVTVAGSANTNATNAVNTAEGAVTIATNASADAEIAISTANSAQNQAQQAVTTANTAVETANNTQHRVDVFEEDINTVLDAADKIFELDESVQIAVQAAETANTAATTASKAATDAIDAVEEVLSSLDSKADKTDIKNGKLTIQANGSTVATFTANQEGDSTANIVIPDSAQWGNITGTLSNQTDLQNALNNRANKDLSNLSSTGEKHFLNKSQITNCLLEVPQNIKLELNNGTLTLKAGSKVIVPNGAGVFEEVVIESDINASAEISGTHSRLVYYNVTENKLDCLASHCSGTTAPTSTSNHFWYDITNNKVKLYYSGAYVDTVFSLPIALVTAGNGQMFNSLDQVFNGFGCIGNTAWADKGVKVLISDGRNTDGSLKNIERTLEKVCVVSSSSAVANGVFVLTPNSITTGGAYLVNYNTYTFSEEEPTTVRWYKPSANMFYIKKNGVWGEDKQVLVGVFTKTTSNITSFEPKLPFRAVDYNDFKKLHVNNPYFFGMYQWFERDPQNLSWLKSSGQWNSGSGYQAFYDWALANANAGKAGFKLSTASYTDYDFVVNTTNKTFRLPIKVQNTPMGGTSPVLAGETINEFDTVLRWRNADLSVTNSTNVILGLYASTNNTSGTGCGGTQSNQTLFQALAPANLYTDLSKATNSNLSLYFYVGETVRDEFLIDVGQIASNFADKIGRTECKAYITETYSSGTSWYRVWSDGWKEQGGVYDNGSAIRDKNGINVTFLKAFKDANYIITPFAYKNDNAPEYRTAVANVYYKTATQATMGWYGTDGNQKVRYLNWYACGY